jgi:elongation factor G
MPAPRPILSVTIAPLSAGDHARLQTALEEIAQSVPPFTKTEQPSGEVILAGESEIHLQAICELLRHGRHIDVAVSPPQVLYLETILKMSEAEGKYIRQTGGSGNYGHVKIRLEPQERGAGIAFINQIRGGVIPEQYIQPVEQGLREAARGGILAGLELVDFKAILYDGSHHEADSNPMAFQIAAALAFKEAARKAHPIVIEPIMTTVFTATENRLSDTLGEISSLRGRVEEVATTHGVTTVRALVPLREMLGYQGPAAHVMHFSHYALANWPPDNDAANASVRNPRGPSPPSDRESASFDSDFDWT